MPKKDANCGAMGSMAAAFMGLRQTGVPISTAMGIAESSSVDTNATAVAREINKLAYSEAQYSLPENKAEASTKFRNVIEEQCYLAVS